MASLDNFRSQLEETAHGWTEQWLAEGMERGIEQGMERGIEQGMERGIEQGKLQGVEQGKRELLRRQAEVRFGTQTAAHLAASLRRVVDPHRLDALAEAVVRCETADELLCQAGRAAPDA